EAGSKPVVLGGRQRARHTRITREDKTGGRVGINLRLDTRRKSLDPVLGVVERLARVPTQAVINRQISPDLVSILTIQTVIFCTGIEKLGAGLVKEVRCSKQVIG